MEIKDWVQAFLSLGAVIVSIIALVRSGRAQDKQIDLQGRQAATEANLARLQTTDFEARRARLVGRMTFIREMIGGNVRLIDDVLPKVADTRLTTVDRHYRLLSQDAKDWSAMLVRGVDDLPDAPMSVLAAIDVAITALGYVEVIPDHLYEFKDTLDLSREQDRKAIENSLTKAKQFLQRAQHSLEIATPAFQSVGVEALSKQYTEAMGQTLSSVVGKYPFDT